MKSLLKNNYICEELVAELAEPSSLERWNARESYLLNEKKKKYLTLYQQSSTSLNQVLRYSESASV